MVLDEWSRSYQLELASFFMYRLAELSARVTLLALFAVGTSWTNQKQCHDYAAATFSIYTIKQKCPCPQSSGEAHSLTSSHEPRVSE